MKTQYMLLSLAVLTTTFLGSAHAKILYTAVDLGSLGGSGAHGKALNDSGTVVGYSYTANGDQHGFVYSNGTMTDLGLGSANGINNAGTVVGYAGVFGSNELAYAYSNGAMYLLPTMTGNRDQALGINNVGTGTIVGASVVDWHDGGGYRATYWINGEVGGLAGEDIWSTAYAINDTGTIVGTDNGLAFVYSNGTMTDLSSRNSDAFGINNSGVIVGNDGDFAFSYSNGTMTDLGYGSANGINNSGVIVGQSGVLACIYNNGIMTDLNTEVQGIGTTLTNATAINYLGQIVANGSNGDAYLLTPVPEPATLLLLGLGAVTLRNKR